MNIVPQERYFGPSRVVPTNQVINHYPKSRHKQFNSAKPQHCASVFKKQIQHFKDCAKFYLSRECNMNRSGNQKIGGGEFLVNSNVILLIFYKKIGNWFFKSASVPEDWKGTTATPMF